MPPICTSQVTHNSYCTTSGIPSPSGGSSGKTTGFNLVVIGYPIGEWMWCSAYWLAITTSIYFYVGVVVEWGGLGCECAQYLPLISWHNYFRSGNYLLRKIHCPSHPHHPPIPILLKPLFKSLPRDFYHPLVQVICTSAGNLYDLPESGLPLYPWCLRFIFLPC